MQIEFGFTTAGYRLDSGQSAGHTVMACQSLISTREYLPPKPELVVLNANLETKPGDLLYLAVPRSKEAARSGADLSWMHWMLPPIGLVLTAYDEQRELLDEFLWNFNSQAPVNFALLESCHLSESLRADATSSSVLPALARRAWSNYVSDQEHLVGKVKVASYRQNTFRLPN